MKLLIVTQVVDTEHPVLSFFTDWIQTFATHCTHVHVIALQVGEYDLPDNVTVHSLGKEAGVGRLGYVIRFFRYCWQLRREYDGVFVHMNQVYVVLGAWLWRLLGKRIGLWYMHGSVSLSLRVAERFTHYVFTGSTESFRLPSKKLLVTGHGIDTKRLVPDPDAKTTSDLITVGRITPSKSLETLLAVLAALSQQTATLTIVGAAVTEAEQQYEARLRQEVESLGVTDRVVWAGRVERADLPGYLQRARVFVTAAQNGSLDKAMLEPLACGIPVVSMAPGSQSLPLGANQVEDQAAFAAAVDSILTTPPDTTALVQYVVAEHGLDRLIQVLLAAYE